MNRHYEAWIHWATTWNGPTATPRKCRIIPRPSSAPSTRPRPKSLTTEQAESVVQSAESIRMTVRIALATYRLSFAALWVDAAAVLVALGAFVGFGFCSKSVGILVAVIILRMMYFWYSVWVHDNDAVAEELLRIGLDDEAKYVAKTGESLPRVVMPNGVDAVKAFLTLERECRYRHKQTCRAISSEVRDLSTKARRSELFRLAQLNAHQHYVARRLRERAELSTQSATKLDRVSAHTMRATDSIRPIRTIRPPRAGRARRARRSATRASPSSSSGSSDGPPSPGSGGLHARVVPNTTAFRHRNEKSESTVGGAA